MKYKSLLPLLIILCGCATMNKNVIENTDRSTLQPLVLIPYIDSYDIRIDLIRQTNEEKVNDSTNENVKTPYHPLGFYLGNGLFLDLNDNLSLLVTTLLPINCDQNFTITESHPGNVFKGKTTYVKTDSLFITRHEGLIDRTTRKVIIGSDSVLFVREGPLSKYRITESDSSVTYQSGLIKTTIHKSTTGYFHRNLFGKKEYNLTDNEILIGERYIIRNDGNAIEILALGLLNSEYLKYRIIRAENRLFVYDSNYRGFEIISTEKELSVANSKRDLNSYSIK